MNKLDVRPESLTVSPAPHLEAAHWLIVLVPCVEADLTAATRRIWELANTGSGRVRFIGLYGDAVQESSLRRQLVTMSAMVGNGGRVYTETELVFGGDWVEALCTRWQAGDMVVCFAEHRVGRSGQSLSNVLQSSLDVPVYILSGIYPQKTLGSVWLAQVGAWCGSLGIILGFFLLQARLGPLTKDWAQLVLLLSIPLEVWMLWAWNSLFG